MWAQPERFPTGAKLSSPTHGWGAMNSSLARQLVSEHPFELVLPTGYEPGYAYPLVVHFHADGGSEFEIHRWFPLISDRNYLGVGLRGPALDATPLPGRYRWTDNDSAAHSALEAVLDELSLDWNVHAGRINLIGEGSGVFTALRLWMQNPGLIAGVICLRPPANWTTQLSPLPDNLPGRLLLDGIDLADPETIAALDALGEAGVDLRIMDGSSPHPARQARAINEWIMSSIDSAIV